MTIVSVKSHSIIYISNKLLDTVFKMTLSEKRVMWFFLKDYKFSDLSTVSLDTQISHSEYAKLYNVSLNQACIEIRKACKSLPNNTYFALRPDWDNNILADFDERIFTREELLGYSAFTTGNVVDVCHFGIKRGVSEIHFTRSFLLHALPVKNYFTQYRLYQANSLNNANHIALYEEIQRWFSNKDNEGVFITTPTRLINKLMLPTTYEKYPQMRRGFIEPALKNINENTNLNVILKEERENPESKRSKVQRLFFYSTGKESSLD